MGHSPQAIAIVRMVMVHTAILKRWLDTLDFFLFC